MIYLTKSATNTLYLNINNNSTSVFTTYTLQFTHILSQEVKTYTIDLSDTDVYGSNDRYCEIVLDLSATDNDLNYLGQYELNVYGNGSTLVLTQMCKLTGETEPGNDFTEYESDNDNGENYIYIN